ncbi:TPA: heavy metal translocating P-type ATPase [Candidatus Geothermarchaeota archaeon]|nr:heavy metal translocating P-type ATPase [Candidatus Geothermarchaeota archaeon]HIQ13712.1 heavy metal translocating P-type ATPase [Thermoprotei archaeon]
MDENVKAKMGVGNRERIKIIGMHCATCALTIEKTSKKLQGVKDVSVSLAAEEAVIEYDPYKISLKDVVREIRKVGYDVYKEEGILLIKNLSTVDDESIIENALLKNPGVVDVKASHVSKTLYITINPMTISFDDIQDKLEELGYKVEKIDTKVEVEDIERKVVESELRKLRWQVALSLILSIPLVAYTVFPVLGITLPLIEYKELIGFILSTPVVFIAGRRFYIGAVRALRNKTANMDTLVALGTGTAYVFSTAVLLGVTVSEEVFFEAAAVIIGFILLGRYLEIKMKLRTGDAVKKLMELQSPNALVMRDGVEVEVPIDQVKIKDIVVIKSGEKIPVDGIVVEGQGYVDESMLTGESIPVNKKERDPVYAGTILRSGYLKVIATRVGKETVLSQIIKLVRYSQSAKPPIQKLVDKISGYFTWIVMGIATLTFLIWYFLIGVELSLAIMFTAAVLLVACPCALGLATPTAVSVGVGMAAEQGIIIKNIEVLEKVDNLTTIVFDKTGTLTKGEPVVTDITVYNGFSEDELLRLAGSAEKGSEHPIGMAIVKAASERFGGVEEPSSFEYIEGQGVFAEVDGKLIILGNEKLMKGFEVDTSLAEEDINKLRNEGKTVIYVAVDKKLAGLIAVADTLKEDSIEVVKKLREEGYRVVMLTGDHRATAYAIAKKLGIEDVFAEVSPEDKTEKIRELQRAGEVVAMVGDGINDAPSLTQSDIGFAMGGGTDIAKEAGDIIIVWNRVEGVYKSLRISKRIKRQIIFNLFWAFIYNIILIPISAGIISYMGIILRPEYAAAAMALSSVSVTGNALLMKRSKLD